MTMLDRLLWWCVRLWLDRPRRRRVKWVKDSKGNIVEAPLDTKTEGEAP